MYRFVGGFVDPSTAHAMTLYSMADCIQEAQRNPDVPNFSFRSKIAQRKASVVPQRNGDGDDEGDGNSEGDTEDEGGNDGELGKGKGDDDDDDDTATVYSAWSGVDDDVQVNDCESANSTSNDMHTLDDVPGMADVSSRYDIPRSSPVASSNHHRMIRMSGQSPARTSVGKEGPPASPARPVNTEPTITIHPKGREITESRDTDEKKVQSSPADSDCEGVSALQDSVLRSAGGRSRGRRGRGGGARGAGGRPQPRKPHVSRIQSPTPEGDEANAGRPPLRRSQRDYATKRKREEEAERERGENIAAVVPAKKKSRGMYVYEDLTTGEIVAEKPE